MESDLELKDETIQTSPDDLKQEEERLFALDSESDDKETVEEDQIRALTGPDKYVYIRKAIGAGVLVTLVALVASSVALIATAPRCNEKLVWWKSAIIYQCYPRSFQDSNGDGSGDLAGITSRVQYLKDLGVKVVWLNPIFASPQKDNGYDISDYTSIDPLYGTLSDFNSLLEALHREGLYLILDFVPNHTSDEHPWFIESRSGVTSAKRDWYVWANPSQDGGPPNNWQSVFGGSAWSLDNLTGQYYLHQFSDFQPDLNYRNPEVISAMQSVLSFWLDLGVDGFRVDAAKFLLEDPYLRNESVDPSFSNTTCNVSIPGCLYNSLIHNLTTDYPGLHDITRGWRKVLDCYSNKLMVAEAYDPIDIVVQYYGTNGDEFNFPFNFFLLGNTNWTASAVSEIISTWLDNMPSGAWANWVLGNHDNPRIASKAGLYLARALNVLLLTLPGTPTTYYGEEILMTNVFVPPNQTQDVYQGRDVERTPMQWDGGLNAGFTSGSPWLPLATNYTTFNVMNESLSNTSMLALYKQLASLRQEFISFAYSLDSVEGNVLSFHRYDSSSSVDYLVVINFASESSTVAIKSPSLHPQLLLSSMLDKSGPVDLSNLSLRGGEALIIKGSLTV
ncbi:hypothetical protein EMCRGX_G032218 [Ephydatia muelleri]